MEAAVTSLAGKSFISIAQLSAAELQALIDHAIDIKKGFQTNPDAARALQPLKGFSMSMIFQKRSTRTRVSTETGMFMLGGHGLMLGTEDIQLGVNESMRDTAAVLSRFNDIILARVFSHSDIAELAKHSSVPVINALSDMYHPLQTLADLMTLQEHFGSVRGKTLAWVGDGNNVLHDLAMGALKLGCNVRISTPQGYAPNAEVMAAAAALAKEHHVTLTLTSDPIEAVTGAHVIVTDTWVSMGQEAEKEKRKVDFAAYQVNAAMMARGDPSVVFLHCLPRKPEEVSDEVFYSSKSLVFQEAENRMWTVMAVAMEVLGKRFPKKL